MANEDHSQNDCLAMVVLSHGINSTFVYAKDNPYPVEVLWSAFTADKCPSLAGKPKLFFVQVNTGIPTVKSDLNYKLKFIFFLGMSRRKT